MIKGDTRSLDNGSDVLPGPLGLGFRALKVSTVPCVIHFPLTTSHSACPGPFLLISLYISLMIEYSEHA